DNLATQGGGAASNGFKADVEYKGCEFIENKGSFAAAIFTQNDTTRLRVNDCYFTSNICEGSGGCILVNTNIAASITNTQFYLNFADFGGAIAANGDSLLILDRCIFLENFATTQAAAINFNHVNALLTNCLFGKNINSGDGAGGGISSNASDGQVSSVKAVNCTFANNLATLGAGIAQWEESDNAIAELYLTNCLFQNPDGENYSIEEGTPDVISTGGNQSSDGSLTAYLTAAKDLSNTSQTFTDPDNNDFRPLPGSPAANGGVTTGAPDVDITGAPRTGTPDVGCYEFNTVNVNVPGLKLLPLSCAPNPAHNQTAVSLSNARQGQVEISVWNQTGQRVVSVLVEKTGEQLNHTLNVQQLPAGVYKIQARMGDMLHESVLVKQ
ncbi:MAG: T9SS type A sorting domain-containing protein, partial [Saprospiraceae bacterium]|nr:T9SS type A sorting domain-containing protein [Saprospiraceae bacterium]